MLFTITRASHAGAAQERCVILHGFAQLSCQFDKEPYPFCFPCSVDHTMPGRRLPRERKRDAGFICAPGWTEGDKNALLHDASHDRGIVVDFFLDITGRIDFQQMVMKIVNSPEQIIEGKRNSLSAQIVRGKSRLFR